MSEPSIIVLYGYLDWSALKNEINPEIPPKDSLTSALSAPLSREWWYLSDAEYEQWIKQIEQYLFSQIPITTAQLVTALVYLKYASDKCAASLRPDTDSRIRERLEQNALSGDESFTGQNRTFLSEQKKIWGPYLEAYDEKAQTAVVKSQVATIVAAIKDENFELFFTTIKQRSEGILAAVSEEGLDALYTMFLKNRLFFNDAVSQLIYQLNTYRGSQIINNMEEKLSRIRALITNLLTRPDLDNSDQQRLKSLLEKLPATDQITRDKQ